MTETTCLARFWGVNIFIFGARLFSMQWPPYGAHILQGRICRLEAMAEVYVEGFW